jgi:hypothetical protein
MTESKRRSIFLIVSLALTSAVLLTACTGDSPIVGSWELSEISADGESYSGSQLKEIGRSGETIEFTDDGNVTWKGNDAVEKGTYAYDPKAETLSLDVTNKDDQTAQYELVLDELSADTLTFSIPDFVTYSFTRQ